MQTGGMVATDVCWSQAVLRQRYLVSTRNQPDEDFQHACRCLEGVVQFAMALHTRSEVQTPA